MMCYTGGKVRSGPEDPRPHLLSRLLKLTNFYLRLEKTIVCGERQAIDVQFLEVSGFATSL